MSDLPAAKHPLSLPAPSYALRSRMTFGDAIIGQLIFLALSLALLALHSWGECFWDDDGWWLSFLFSIQCAWIFWSWHTLTGRWCDAYSLFFLAISLFNGGQLFLEVCRLNPHGILASRFSPETRDLAILLANAAIAAFHLGGIFGIRSELVPDAPRLRPQIPTQPPRYSAQRAHLLATSLLIVSAPLTCYLLVATFREVAASGRFAALFQRDIAIGINNWQETAATAFLPSILIEMALLRKNQFAVRLCWCAGLAYVGTYLLMGNRGLSIAALAGLMLLHHTAVRPIKPRLAILTFCVIGAACPIIAMVRNFSANEQIAMLKGEISLEEIPYITLVYEMGNSLETVAYTIDIIPQERPYDLGQGYYYAALVAIPNIAWDVHPTAEHGVFSRWLVKTVAPRIAEVGGGLGYALVAEAYANFGNFGPPLVLGLFGFLLARFVAAVHTGGQPFLFAMEAFMVTFLLHVPRGETADITRPLVWFVLLPYLIVRNKT